MANPVELPQGYRCIEKIGSGAFGEVWKVFHESKRRYEALKFLYGDRNDTERLRFCREMTILSHLNPHPNIVSIYYVDPEKRYFIMEYLDGGSLDRWIEEENTLQKWGRQEEKRILRCLEIIHQIAMGLFFLHQKKIIHRDLKPGNILFTRNKAAKICDFGLAKNVADQQLNTVGAMGTPLYMAPEQWGDASRIDIRSDIWALGIILYQMLARRLPFSGQGFQLMYQILNCAIPSLREVASLPQDSVTTMAIRLCEKALNKDREKRYQNLAEMLITTGFVLKHSAKAPCVQVPVTLQTKVMKSCGFDNQKARCPVCQKGITWDDMIAQKAFYQQVGRRY